MTSNEILRAAGEALYGSRWQTDLADALDVNDRTMRRWVAGGTIPAEVIDDLKRLVRKKRETLKTLLDDMGWPIREAEESIRVG